MADEAARRRELRRRRILENAEERKRKIFGASSTANSTTVKDELQKPEEPGISALHNDIASDLQSKEEAVTNKTCSVNTSALNNDLGNAATSNSSSHHRESTTVNARENNNDLGNAATSNSSSHHRESINVNVRESTNINARESTNINTRENTNLNVRDSIYHYARESSNLSTGESTDNNARESINGNHSRLYNSNRIQNGSIPDLTEQLLNFNRLMTANGGISPSSVHNGRTQEDVQPVASVETLNSSMVPFVLALLVCSLLSLNLGYVVSNSISIPFMLWEAQHLWCQRYAIQASSRGGAGLLGIAFMLCGVRQSTLMAYAHIITIVKCFLEDFALYILSVVLWCTVIGLPGVVRPESLESSHPMVSREEVPGDADMFSSVDDF